MANQKSLEVKEHITRPRIIVPIEGWLWLLLSLLCWSIDWFSTVASTTTLHLIIHIYKDIMRKNVQTHDQRKDLPRLWRHLMTTSPTTNDHSNSDGEGKYLSITLIPILLESMSVLSKQQNNSTGFAGHYDTPVNAHQHVTSYWHNIAMIVSILQIFLWNVSLYHNMNHQNIWMRQQVILHSIAICSFVLLLCLSRWNSFQQIEGEIWFSFFWIYIFIMFGPFYHLSLQGIMTCGEWSVISFCFAMVGSSIWTEAWKEMKYIMFLQGSNSIGRHETEHSVSTVMVATVIYAYTATAGLLGCIVACSTVSRVFPYKTTNQMLQQNYPNITKFCQSSVITNVLRIIYISFITLGIVECMFWLFHLTPQHHFPKCIWWIVYDFLLAIEKSTFVNQMERESSYIVQWVLPASKLPRISWLVYWFITMLATIPFAPTTTGKISPVIARKWFHFIAILLFVPTTVLVPQLQSLSYAVAICVLLIIEVLRVDIPMLNDFYYTYLDQTKDEADDSKFVISHIALVAGCALPLWIKQYFNYSSPGGHIDSPWTNTFNAVMGLWGVWVLGIGDAMGAMIGKSFGRHRWGSNSRTIEGSMAMFLSLCLVCVISIVYTPNTTATMQSETPTVYSVGQWLPAVVFVTLIEAYTLQIDNIVLPFAGVTMILVCQSIMLKHGVNT